MLMMKCACERCQKPLPLISDEAMICSFECTFCLQCTREVFDGKCPNCSGELVHRPKRFQCTQEVRNE